MNVQYNEDDLDANKWESLIDRLYKIKYSNEGYHYVPARRDGDCGIEGYTKTGIVFQCYFPEGPYSVDELYEKLRDKLTTDIKKLITYEAKLKNMGVIDIKEWHFVIPKYEDRRILEHAYTKQEKMRKAKKDGKISIINDNFEIHVKVLDNFTEEMNCLIKNDIDYKYKLPEIKNVDFSQCESIKKDNISRKIATLRNNLNDDKSDRLINLYIEYYLKGIQMLNEIREHSFELFEEVEKIEQAYRKDLEIRCVTNTDSSINQEMFREILNNFEETLKKELENVLDYKDIGELKQEMIGKWLADCPLDFAD
ncbi:MAG: hypothetical protein K1W33_01760 [Clostridia bacterium]